MSITAFKSMAESCLLSPPTCALLFNKTKPSKRPFLLSLSKPLKLQLSSNNSLTLTARTHRSLFPLFVAHQGDGDTLTLQDQQQQEEGVSETEASLSDWEPNGEEEAAAEGDFVEPSEDAKLFVGNLPYDVDSQKLAMLFEQAGTVEIAEVIYNRESDQSRGFGFVTMSTVEEAEEAVEKFNRYDYGGRLLTVNKASPRGSRPERPPRTSEPALRVYVGNLPWDVDNTRLEQVFSEHGKVLRAQVVSDRETGRSRGFGFVTMSNETEMNDAIAALDGQSLDGRTIRVSVAEDRPRRGSF